MRTVGSPSPSNVAPAAGPRSMKAVEGCAKQTSRTLSTRIEVAQTLEFPSCTTFPEH